MTRLCGDPAPARRILGVEARVGLEEGLARTLEWMRARQGSHGAMDYNV